MRKILFATILGGMLGAHAADTPKCEKLLRGVLPLYSETLARQCMAHYFPRQNLDAPVGSYNKVSRFGYLALARNPRHAETTLQLAWVTYSQGQNFQREQPDPAHGGKHAEMRRILAEARRHLGRDFKFLREGALYLALQIRFARDVGNAFAMAQDFLNQALTVAANDAGRVRILLDLGHLHRNVNRVEEARLYYERVLAIDPQNVVAKRYLAS